MINERDQESFLDLIRPPADFELSYCIGTSFTLELPCLIQMALNSRGSKTEVENLSIHEGFEAISEFASKSIVFAQNCKIKSLPEDNVNAGNSQKGRFFGLLDEMVAEVPTETIKSSFHPKVWFLRFDPEEGSEPPVFKLFTMSRNLTSALNWDVSVCLIGGTGKTGRQNANLIEFFKFLGSKSSVRNKGSKVLEKAIGDLNRIHFDLPNKGSFKNFEFNYKWGEQKKFKPLPFESSKRAVVISPFLSEAMLKKVAPIKDLHLITSSKDLGEVDKIPSMHERTYILNMGAMSLHSKMYLIEGETASSITLGSANFTNSGWLRDNVEANITLSAAKNSVKKFKEEFIYDSSGRLNNWLTKYAPSDLEVEVQEDEVEKIRNELDDVQRNLSTGEFFLSYSKGVCRLRYERADIEFPEGLSGAVAVMGINASVTLADILQDKAQLENVKLRELTSFLAIKLKYKGEVSEFCTVAISDFDRKERNQSILSETIRDWQSFWDYLGIVLDIKSAGAQAQSISTEGDAPGRGSQRHKNRGSLLRYLEPILLAGVSDSRMVEKIDAAISALETREKSDFDGYRLDTFLGFWSEYKAAYEEFKKHG